VLPVPQQLVGQVREFSRFRKAQKQVQVLDPLPLRPVQPDLFDRRAPQHRDRVHDRPPDTVQQLGVDLVVREPVLGLKQHAPIRVDADHPRAQSHALLVVTQVRDLLLQPLGQRDVVGVHPREQRASRRAEGIVQRADDARVGPADDLDPRVALRVLI
jgi:hypothetical protein